MSCFLGWLRCTHHMMGLASGRGSEGIYNGTGMGRRRMRVIESSPGARFSQSQLRVTVFTAEQIHWTSDCASAPDTPLLQSTGSSLPGESAAQNILCATESLPVTLKLDS